MQIVAEDTNCVANVLHTSLRGERESDDLRNYRNEKST